MMTNRSPEDLLRDDRGAVLAEMALAMMPLLSIFFSLVQLSKLATMRIVVKHAAIVAARAAIVISNGSANNPGQADGANDAEIKAAATAALGPWAKQTDVTVAVADRSSIDDPYDLVTVTVNARYTCNVPLASRIVCGLNGKKTLTETVSLPHQGARYKLK